MAAQSPRSVMVLIADDWSPLGGCYGTPNLSTPNVDAFAARATLFENGFCASPSCAVSRASLLTGLHSHQHGQYGHCHGVNGFRTHEWVRSVPAALSARNVRTGLIGKSHVAPESVFPFDLDVFGNANSAEDLGHRAETFLRDVGDQPFMLWVASLRPHREGPGFGNDRLQDEYRDLPVYRPEDVTVPGFLPDLPAVREDLADYYTAVGRFDRFVGRLMQALQASGRAKDTLVLLLSDHGMPFPGAKASSFDTGHRCPLLIQHPDRPSERRSSAMVSWVDVAPTLYEWFDVPGELQAEGMTGRSLLPILDEADPADRSAVYFSHNFHEVTNYYPYRALREKQYKFVQHLASDLPTPIPTDLYRSKTWQGVLASGDTSMGRRTVEGFLHRDAEALYDVQNDPMETNNLIGDPDYASLVQRMRGELYDFRTRTNDPWMELDFQRGRIADWPE
jgi:N-sulfoglucosamine sulfohydrolase